jgi:hypothetical protein
MQGKVVVVAIGATAVGSIVQLNKPGDDVKKGECFGYFQFGGSTCIMLTQKGRMQFDDDLLETAVRELSIHSWISLCLSVPSHRNRPVCVGDRHRALCANG